jgi:hypothetical protein
MINNRTREVVPFMSGHRWAQYVLILLAVFVVLDIVAAVSGYLEIRLLSRVIGGETVTMAESTASDNRQALINYIYIVLFYINIVLFCVWIYRAHRNLPSLGARGLKYSPWWAVGGFFTPLLNFIRPLQVTTEIWKASDPMADINDSVTWQSMSTSSFIISWWVLFLMSGFVGNIILRFSLNAETVGEMLTKSWVAFATNIVEIPAAILLILIIRGIDLRQAKKNQVVSAHIIV